MCIEVQGSRHMGGLSLAFTATLLLFAYKQEGQAKSKDPSDLGYAERCMQTPCTDACMHKVQTRDRRQQHPCVSHEPSLILHLTNGLFGVWSQTVGEDHQA